MTAVACSTVAGWCGVVLFGGRCSFGVGGLFGSVVLVSGVWEGLRTGLDRCGVLVSAVERKQKWEWEPDGGGGKASGSGSGSRGESERKQ